MTKPSACVGPSRLRFFALSTIVVTTILTTAVSPVRADAANLTSPGFTPPMPKSPVVEAFPTFPAFLDDRRLQAIERQAGPRFEALARRRAEKLRRKAIEAEVKRKAEAMRRSVDAAAGTTDGTTDADHGARETIVNLIAPAQANAAPLPTGGIGATAVPIRATAGMAFPLSSILAKSKPPAVCAPGTVSSEPLPGGRIALKIAAPCRTGELVTIRYTPYVFMRRLDSDGRLRFVLDLFQGAEPAVTVVFASGETMPVAIGPTDIEQVSKVAVIWGKPVNLDLHVYEYAAAAGTAGHVWSKAASDADTARKASLQTQRGRGFISFASDGTEPGHQVEVYTLWHYPSQSSGVVSTALDYETRASAGSGPTCGDGALSEIPFETITFAPRRLPVRERGLISRAPCGDALLERARFQDDAIADLPATVE